MKRQQAVKSLIALSASLLIAPWAPAALAADKPPLRILVGYSPGGGSDNLARILAEDLRTTLGRVVIVDNKPGAGGRIAAQMLKNSAGDDNTVMVAPNGLTTVQSIVYKAQLPYDPQHDLVPVAMLVDTPLAVAVSTRIDVKDARQLAACVKAHPDKAAFGSPAAGGLPHFVDLQVAQAMGGDWLHVPYKGGAPTALALLSGEVPIGITTIDDFIKQDGEGRLKIVGVTSARRSSLAPQVPTLLEQGFDVQAAGWSALWTSPGTSPAAIAELSAAVQKALDNPAVKARLASIAMEPAYLASAELAAVQKAEWLKYAPVIAASGFKPN